MKITRRKFIRTGLFVTLGALLADMFWFEKFFIETNEFHIGKATEKTKKIKLIQISDLHLRSVNYRLKKLAEKLNKLQPELIMITGDAIDAAKNISLLDEFLNLIDKQIQKVAILGNWEYWGHVDLVQLNEIYASNNCTLLINQTKQYTFGSTSVSVTGVDDFIGGNADFNSATKNYKESDHHIVLNHCPQYGDQIAAELSETTKADIILSGHTHGGQFNLFGFAPFMPPGSGRFVKGWYNLNGTDLYVSKGIGTSILPARFGARAEIAIFYL